MEKELERSAQEIPPGQLAQLIKLALHHNWLEEESLALAELWNLCKKERQQNLLYDLIYRFNYITSSQLKTNGQIIADHIVNEWKIKSKKTKIVAVSDNRNADGSLMFIQSIKNKFAIHHWNEDNFVKDIGLGVKETRGNYNVILLDDFIGTGNTIERRVNWFLNELEEKNKTGVKLMVVALAALEIAKEKLDGLKIDYFVPIWLKRGISDHYSGNGLKSAVIDMLNLEDLLEEKYRKWNLTSFSFGYNKSEALFAIESFNVPNNVFPIFWWPILKGGKNRRTIFNRLR